MFDEKNLEKILRVIIPTLLKMKKFFISFYNYIKEKIEEIKEK